MQNDLRLSLRALRAFATVVEHGSISAAANSLHTAPSAVAALVAQVETEMGADLLVRTRARGVAATAEGRALAARFRRLLEDYSGILEDGRDMARGLSGTLRVGYYAPVAPAFLPPILGPLMQANPDLRLDLQEHDNNSVQDALLSGRLDAIIFAADDIRAGITTTPLLSLPPYALLPKDHPLAAKKRVALTQLVQYPLIKLNRPISRPYVDALLSERSLTPTTAADVDSTEMVRSLVGAGLGVAILSMRPVTAQSYAGDLLVMRPLDPGLPCLELRSGHVAGHPRRLARAFLDALHTWMHSDAARAVTMSDDHSSSHHGP